MAALNITAEMPDTRIASDLCADIIMLWDAASKGWEPPTRISEEEYKAARTAPSSAYRGFVGFGCSFGGKFFGGYARSGTRNYAMNAHNAILKKAKALRGVHFSCGPYDSLAPKNSLVYCDPPYAGTTQGYSSTSFDSARFWNTMLEWSKRGNTVIVSEYVAPDFCKEVWRIEIKTDMHCKTGKEPRVEKLFQVGQGS